MRIGIIYYSGTGATARFAEEITLGFREAGHEVKLFKFNQVKPNTVLDFDLLGFGSPTYSYRAVRAFTTFLASVPIAQKPYFIFNTCGGQPGNTIWNMYQVLKKRRWLYLGSLVGHGNNNIRAWRLKIGKTPENDEIDAVDMAAARDLAQNILHIHENVIINKGKLPKSPKFHVLLIPFTWLFTWPFEMRVLEGNKMVDPKSCTKCGLCANRICNSGAITIGEDKFPHIDNSKCIGCSGCVNLCPSLAIYSKKVQNKQPYTAYAKWILNPPK